MHIAFIVCEMGLECSLVVGYLPNMYRALGSVPKTNRNRSPRRISFTRLMPFTIYKVIRPLLVV